MIGETASRDRIAVHSKRYFRALLADPPAARTAAHEPSIHLLIAEHGGEPLAAAMVSVYRSEAIYLFGASYTKGRHLMPTYAVQWEAIRLAKRSGCAIYDLFGIPPTADPSHPMNGLYRIKTGFGGRVTHRAGCWDMPLSAAAYAAYRVAERARIWYFRRLRKRISAGE
jgi:lipid II:glycine glycyltransferase (peptidoglycan interpeptide bridge formation enzyme)